MAWYDKSGGPSFIELYEEAAGDQCGICRGIKPCCKSAGNCRERAQTAPLHTLSWHYCKGSAANGQQSARYWKGVEETLPEAVLTLLRCS